jgi:hypothetical protein
MLLLPSLLRDATGRDHLDFQVAPGVAEASWSQLSTLDLEAPKVAYLLDGDSGGDAHANRLIAIGVPADRIVRLGEKGSGWTLEDLIREEVYLAAINEAVTRVHGPGFSVKASDVAARKRAHSFDKWCDSKGLRRIPKTYVALIVLEQEAPSLTTQTTRAVLRTAHEALAAALGLT